MWRACRARLVLPEGGGAEGTGDRARVGGVAEPKGGEGDDGDQELPRGQDILAGELDVTRLQSLARLEM